MLYLILAIAVIALLLVLFVISFVLYVKTPAPKGCKSPSEEACAGCNKKGCEFSLYQAKGSLKGESKEDTKEKENESDPN